MADVAIADPTLTSWIQTGGVVAFASLVFYELRQLRPLVKEWIEQRKEDRGLLAEVKNILSVLLERERMRSEQRAKLLRLSAERMGGAPEDWDTDDTGAFEVETPSRPVKRPKTNPHGHPSGEYSILRRKPGEP